MNKYEKGWTVPGLIAMYNGMDEYDPDLCEEICRAAGMKKEWEAADGENFEAVVEKAANYLKERWHLK